MSVDDPLITMFRWQWSTRTALDVPDSCKVPAAVEGLDPFCVRAIPVNRKDFPAVVPMENKTPFPVVSLRITVWSAPVVEAPPVVAEMAPAPWIVTELLNVTDICCEPVQVQLPVGIE